jgi:hypothetical protein
MLSPRRLPNLIDSPVPTRREGAHGTSFDPVHGAVVSAASPRTLLFEKMGIPIFRPLKRALRCNSVLDPQAGAVGPSSFCPLKRAVIAVAVQFFGRDDDGGCLIFRPALSNLTFT